MKKTLLAIKLVATFLMLFSISLNAQSQSRSLEKAQKYLKVKGEVAFTFKANSIKEVQELAKTVSFDHGQNPNTPLTIKAIASKQQFERFLEFGINYTVDDKANAPKSVLMTNSKEYKGSIGNITSKFAAPLTFPLTAYPTYQDYADQMALFAANNPSICQLVDLGPTTEGDKNILFVKLSDNVTTDEQEPRMMYTSSMHGDEIAGYPLMLNLIDYFITAYNDTGHSDHTRVKDLLDNSEIWINPNANPDGTYYNDPTNTSVANARRANANGWDLNRNYPDNIGGAHPDGNPNYEIETQHFMTLADNHHFVLSANFHGGTEVVNYPWDNTYTRHADDDWYFHISKEYAVNCQDDELAYNGTTNYMDATYTNYVWPGVTNGADWYRVEGGRQDYMNYYQQCKETTIELSNAKTPAASLLDDLWDWNREALIDYLVQGTYGFRGVVKDASTNNPIEATVTLVGHDNTNSHTFSEATFGDYYRPAKAGTYTLLFEADCYQSVTVSSQTIADYETKVLSDVLLTPIANSAPNNLNANNITGTSATISWDAITGATYDYRYRIVGAPSWTEASTSNTSENLIGLSAATQYEVQVRSNCNSNTSSYSSSIFFTTSNTVIIHEGYFESGFDGWADGGNDVSYYTGSLSYEGNGSIRLRDNSGTSSAMTSPSFNLSSYGSVTVDFWFYANSMENGEDIWLRYNDGSGWQTIATWASGSTFNNNAFNNVSTVLSDSSFNLTSNGQFRIQCDASGNNDQVYIDQVIITGIPSGPDVTPPSTPNNLVASNTTQTTTDLSWDASTDNISVTGYDIYQNGGFIANTANTNYQVTGLTASTSYSFYVIARDAAGNSSAQSNTANVTTLDPPDTEAPTAPTSLVASNTTEFTTDLSWNASTDNVGVTGYDLYQDGVFLVNTASTNYQVTDLSPSTTYSFYVIARDAAGNSSTQSNSVNVTTDAFVDTEAPSTPTGLSASNITENSIDLNWNSSTDNVGVTGYDIYQDSVFLTNVSGTSHQVTGLAESTTYNFYVIARDAAGNSSGQSNNINPTTLAAPTCSDGIQNGDETGVDCGGSVCPACPPSDTTINEVYFETGFDGWADGGNDALHYTGSFSYEGNGSIRLRDNSGVSSSITSPSFNLSSFNEVEISFHFYANSMENGEDVWLRYNDGSGWSTIATWASGSGFTNNSFNFVSVTLDSGTFNLTNGAQFRIQCDAGQKNDQVYVDQVIIIGRNSSAAAKSSAQAKLLSTTSNTARNTLLLYPNPVKGSTLNIHFSEVSSVNYRILNTLGQEVKSGTTTKEINVSNLEAGLYFIEVNNGKTIANKRFIKE